MNIGTEPHILFCTTAADSFFNTVKGTAANKENIRRVNLQHFLMRMLAAALRRHIGFRSFQDFQQCLLYAFAGNVSRNGRIFRLPGDFIDFINVNNAPFRSGNIEIRRLDQFEEAVFHVFTDITGFCKTGRIGNRKGNIQKSGQSLREKRFAAACRADHDDIGFLQLYITAVHAAVGL